MISEYFLMFKTKRTSCKKKKKVCAIYFASWLSVFPPGSNALVKINCEHVGCVKWLKIILQLF